MRVSVQKHRQDNYLVLVSVGPTCISSLYFLGKLAGVVVQASCDIWWRPLDNFGSIYKERKQNCERDKETLSGQWSTKKNDPCEKHHHYLPLFSPSFHHNDDGKTLNVPNRFLGLKSWPCHPIGPCLFKPFLCYICYRFKKLYYSHVCEFQPCFK